MRFLVVLTVFMIPVTGHSHGGNAEGHFEPDFVNHDLEWNTGGKLVREQFDCAKCHTPRENHEAEKYDRMGPLSGFHGPNITQDPLNGIGTWSIEDIELFLAKGLTPPPIVDYVGGEMAAVINQTSTLTAAQRHAMAVYLKSLAPVDSTQIHHGVGDQDGAGKTDNTKGIN